MTTKSNALNSFSAWNSVTLEERFELISKAQANGIFACLTTITFVGCVAYALNQVWMMAIAVGCGFFVMPLFANHYWRKAKPQIILSYLAARSVARRFAYGHKFYDLDIIMIFRGSFEKIYESTEDKAIKQYQINNFDFDQRSVKDVWVALLKGGIIILSERPGGAKLEFACRFAPSVLCRKTEARDHATYDGLFIEGFSGAGIKEKVVISSTYAGALYVFERYVLKLLEDVKEILKRREEEKEKKVSK